MNSSSKLTITTQIHHSRAQIAAQIITPLRQSARPDLHRHVHSLRRLRRRLPLPDPLLPQFPPSVQKNRAVVAPESVRTEIRVLNRHRRDQSRVERRPWRGGVVEGFYGH